MEYFLLIILIGFIVGTLIGMTGMGGGALMTPILITILKIEPIIAIGSDIVYAAITKIAGSYQHIKQKTVDFTLVKNLAIGSVPGAIAGSLLSYIMKDSGINIDEFIRIALGTALCTISVLLSISLFWNINNYKDKLHHWLKIDKYKKIAVALVGLLGGLLVGLTSVGSGTIMIVLILIIYNTSLRKIIGSDIVHATILLFTAGLAHLFVGNVDWQLVIFLLIGSIPGVILGSKLSSFIPKNIIRSLLIILLLVFGFKMIIY